jgi:acyl carrier protein
VREAPFTAQDHAALADTLASKIAGTWSLHQLSLQHGLDFFIVYSSVASVWGSSGLAAYAGANEFLNTLAAFRRSLGAPASSVCWGMWNGPGLATSQMREHWTKLGVGAMQPESALDLLESVSAGGEAVSVIADVNWARFRSVYELQRRRPLLAWLEQGAPAASPEQPAAHTAYRSELAQLPAAEQRARLLQLLRDTAARVLGLDDYRAVDADAGLFSMGFDSVTIVELSARLGAMLQLSCPPTLVFNHPTLRQLGDFLWREFFAGAEGEAQTAGDSEGESLDSILAFIEGIDDHEAERLLSATAPRTGSIQQEGGVQ